MVIMTRIQSLYVGMFVFSVWCVCMSCLYYFHKHSLYLFNFLHTNFSVCFFKNTKSNFLSHEAMQIFFKIF